MWVGWLPHIWWPRGSGSLTYLPHLLVSSFLSDITWLLCFPPLDSGIQVPSIYESGFSKLGLPGPGQMTTQLVKSICRGPWFSSQILRGDSQSLLSSDPGDLTPSGLLRHQPRAWWTCVHGGPKVCEVVNVLGSELALVTYVHSRLGKTRTQPQKQKSQAAK